jgi:hypothetical protein
MLTINVCINVKLKANVFLLTFMYKLTSLLNQLVTNSLIAQAHKHLGWESKESDPKYRDAFNLG